VTIPWRLRPAFAVIAIVLSIAALAPREAAAASCAGSSHTMALSEGTVSPGYGTTDATFTFMVVYTDSGGCVPDRIGVVIAGLGELALSHLGGDLQAGATFGRAMTLPAGARRYSFSAESGSGPGSRTATFTNVEPPKVVVVAPTPKPPKPTERPKPAPTAAPTPPATATPAPAVSTAEPVETPAPSHSDPTSVSSQPAATSALGAAGPVDSLRPGGIAAASSATASWDRNIPRPVLALLVSSLGTLFGLALFAAMATRLIGPRPRLDVGAARRQGRDVDAAQHGSGR